MKTIKLQSKLESIIPFEKGWLINIGPIEGLYHYCIVDLEWNIKNYFGAAMKGFFNEDGFIILCDSRGKRNGFLNKEGYAKLTGEKCIVNNNSKYKWKLIKKNSIFDGMFEIPEDKIGLALNKINKNYIVMCLPKNFDKQDEFEEINLSVSSDEKSILIYQRRGKEIILIENPIQ